MFPPTVDTRWLAGSGAKKRPCGFAAALTPRFGTPGSTTARVISAKSAAGSSCRLPWNARRQCAFGHFRTKRSFGTSDAAGTPASGVTAWVFFVLTRQGYGSGVPSEIQMRFFDSKYGEVISAVAANVPAPVTYQTSPSPGAIFST